MILDVAWSLVWHDIKQHVEISRRMHAWPHTRLLMMLRRFARMCTEFHVIRCNLILHNPCQQKASTKKKTSAESSTPQNPMRTVHTGKHTRTYRPHQPTCC